MQEIIRGYLRNWDEQPSLDNIDFDTMIYLKRMKKAGNGFEFGKVEWRDGSVEIKVELPEPPILPESQAEWEEKRQWYLQHAGNCVKTLRRGICEGYIIDGRGIGLDEVWGDLANAASDMQNEEAFGETPDEIYEYYHNPWINNEGPTRRKNKEKPNPKRFLQKGQNLTYSLIEGAKILRNNLLEGRRWRSEDFRELGFELPEFKNYAQEAMYVIDTLESFLKEVGKSPREVPKRQLREIAKIAGLRGLPIQDSENPWQVYEVLKERYCLRTDSLREYNRRIEEVVFALRV